MRCAMCLELEYFSFFFFWKSMLGSVWFEFILVVPLLLECKNYVKEKNAYKRKNSCMEGDVAA
jgi:hypothetical protein